MLDWPTIVALDNIYDLQVLQSFANKFPPKRPIDANNFQNCLITVYVFLDNVNVIR